MAIETVNALASFALVIITGYYAWTTHKTLKENKIMASTMSLQTELLTRPYINIYPFLVTNTTMLYLKIENSGKTPAWNLRLEIDRDFYRYNEVKEGNNLKEFSAFTNIIECFPPAANIVFSYQ